MNRLFETLIEKFGFEKFEALSGGFFLVRNWSRLIDVAWYGEREETYKVYVEPYASDCVKVSFYREYRLEKEKIYSSGPARTLNAIRETVKYAGYEM